jgi:choline dehydrogenase
MQRFTVEGQEFDYIIVGAGTAGCILAHRLSADPGVSVLLIDAGRWERHWALRLPFMVGQVAFTPRWQWGYVSEPDDTRRDRATPISAGKVFGGGSAINAMAYVLPSPQDLARWNAASGGLWSFAECLPAIRAFERAPFGDPAWRGTAGRIGVRLVESEHPVSDDYMAAMAAAGIPFTADYNAGHRATAIGWGQLNQNGGLRADTASTYLAEAARRPNLTVIEEAPLLALDGAGERIHGIAYLFENAARRVRANREVILAAGTMQTPKILLQAGIGPTAELRGQGIAPRRDLPGVGRNLMDHVCLITSHIARKKTLNQELNALDMLRHAATFALARKGPIAGVLAHANGFVETTPGDPQSLTQIGFSPVGFDLGPKGRHLVPQPAVTTVIGTLATKSRGRITLKSDDPLAHPRIEHRLFAEPDDLRYARDAVKFIHHLYQGAAFRAVIEGPRVPDAKNADDAAWETYIRGAARSYAHMCGTCAMGVDPQDGAVVDARGKVHGIDGLRIADMSIAPILVSGNTNATAMMIGERIAQLIAAERNGAAATAGTATAGAATAAEAPLTEGAF